MHEMGITLEIVGVALSALPAGVGQGKVSVLNLKIGKLSAVLPDSLRFCFDIATRGTPLAGARLDIEEIPIAVRCRDCGDRTVIEQMNFACGRCGGARLDVVTGRELMVSSLELKD